MRMLARKPRPHGSTTLPLPCLALPMPFAQHTCLAAAQDGPRHPDPRRVVCIALSLEHKVVCRLRALHKPRLHDALNVPVDARVLRPAGCVAGQHPAGGALHVAIEGEELPMQRQPGVLLVLLQQLGQGGAPLLRHNELIGINEACRVEGRAEYRGKQKGEGRTL